MADKRINDHIKTTTAANVDEFIIDSDANGTRNITYANLQTQVKQYVLGDMDEVPTQNSNNPVKSGGIFSTMAVPKYDSANRREYFEGGAAFDGNIDSSPTAGSNNAVASGGTKTYVDNAVDGLASKFNWKVAGAFNADGGITLNYSLDSASEIMITLFLGLPRQTVLIDSISRLRQYNLFPDFLTYEGRVYARITYVDATHVTISQLTGLSALGSSAQLIIEIR